MKRQDFSYSVCKAMCDNTIYEDVFIQTTKNECYADSRTLKASSNDRPFTQTAKNEYYEDSRVLKTSSDDRPKNSTLCRAPSTTSEKRQSSKKVLVLVFAPLVLMLGAVAACTVYALVEIFKLKAEIQGQKYSTLQSISNASARTISVVDARIAEMQHTTFQNMSNTFAEVIAEVNAQVAQSQNQQRAMFQNISNAFAEVIADINAQVAQIQTYSQDAAEQTARAILAIEQQFTQNNSALNTELRHLTNSSSFTHQQLNTSISVLNVILGQNSTSCDTLPTSSSAGYYNFTSANGSPLHQYCPPISTRCGLPGRWQTIADLDMTNDTHQCYSPLQQSVKYSNKRLCVRSSIYSLCYSVQLPTTAPYKSVCGLVRAYQFGQPEAFFYFERSTIDQTYVDGVSITHGRPRQHIWTFAAAASETFNHTGCPCMGGRDRRPRFVKNDYFCDTGTFNNTGFEFYGDNPLWDGAGCGLTNSCCDFNNPPWFYKELPQYTCDDIELRLCNSNRASDEDIAIEKIEIYVK